MDVCLYIYICIYKSTYIHIHMNADAAYMHADMRGSRQPWVSNVAHTKGKKRKKAQTYGAEMSGCSSTA